MTETTANAELRERLAAQRLLGIIRGKDRQASVRTALTLMEAGVNLIEVSVTTTDAYRVIKEIAAAAQGGIHLGAGTTLSAESVRRAVDAGAGFVLTPSLCPGLDEARRMSVPIIPGALTPSEVTAALELAPAAVKLFPANAFEKRYTRDLRAPLPDLDIVAVGGVGLDDLQGYFAAGVLAVGVGSPLCGDAPDGGDQGELRRRANEFVARAGAA